MVVFVLPAVLPVVMLPVVCVGEQVLVEVIVLVVEVRVLVVVAVAVAVTASDL